MENEVWASDEIAALVQEHPEAKVEIITVNGAHIKVDRITGTGVDWITVQSGERTALVMLNAISTVLF